MKATFKKYIAFRGPEAGIERNLLFEKAAAAGLYVKGTYGSPFSEALDNMCTVHIGYDANGNFAYHFFRLKKEATA